MSVATAIEPILLDLDEKTWDQQIDRTESWLGNVLLTQGEFRKYAADTANKIREPHIQRYLKEVTARAQLESAQTAPGHYQAGWSD